jgi:Polyketide cyclase / dehydrase and lipid transport
MASIWWEEPVAAPADLAWAALRHVGMAHQLFSPVLVDSTVEGDIRTVTFANGLVVRERIIAVDERRRRIAYSVLGGTFDHHSASMQILPIDRASCRFLWVSDFLPHERADTVRPLVEQGSRALARNIEGGRALGS